MAADITGFPCYDAQRHFIGTPRALCCALIPRHLLSDSEDIIGLALNTLDSRWRPLPLFSKVLIDEAQNLSPAMIRLIDRITDPDKNSTTYFINPGEAIFAFAGATSDTIALIRARCGNRIMRLSLRHRPSPVMLQPISASYSADAILKAAEEAKKMSAPEVTMAILTRTNAEAAEVMEALQRKGIQAVLISARLIASDNPKVPKHISPFRHYSLRQSDTVNVSPGTVAVGTVHICRDRTFDHVILLATAGSTSEVITPEEQRRLSTGRNRALRSSLTVTLDTHP